MERPEVTRAITAAKSIATSLGLPTDDAVVLHTSNKLALRLTPCDVVARVDPGGEKRARFEVELAQRLLDAGGPIVPLDPRVEPRVYTRAGFAVTLWTFCEPVTSQVDSDAYALALKRLHGALRGIDLSSPRFTDRIAAAERIVSVATRSPELGDVDRAFLADRLRSLRQATENHGADEQPLHGEQRPPDEGRPVVPGFRDVLPWAGRV